MTIRLRDAFPVRRLAVYARRTGVVEISMFIYVYMCNYFSLLVTPNCV